LALRLYGIFNFGNFRFVVCASENCNEQQNGIVGCAHFSYCFSMVAFRYLQRMDNSGEHCKYFSLSNQYQLEWLGNFRDNLGSNPDFSSWNNKSDCYVETQYA